MNSGDRKILNIFFLLCFLLPCRQIAPAGEDSYRIQHYHLRIVPDFKSRALALAATIDIDNPLLRDSFAFGLNDRYETVNVTCPSSPVRIERGQGMIAVHVSEPTANMSLSFELNGHPGKSDDENCDVVTDSSLFLLWSDRFYPIDFDHWASVRTEVQLPSNFQAIAPGRLMHTERSGFTTTYIFESTIPTVKFSLFADARWIRTERRVHGIDMQTLLHPQSQHFSEQIFTTSSEVLGFFSTIMCPYPFEQFSFVTISGMYARRAFPGFVGYEPRYLEKEFSTTGHDAHETSLLWWGYTIHGEGPGSFQWTEGFGDYVEILYDEEYRKPIPKIFERFRSEYLELPAEQDVPYTELRGNTPQKIVHGKYPWLMHLVRYTVGDSAFSVALRLLFERYRHRTFSIGEFISTLEEGSGQSLQWWRKEWLERKGVPDIAFSARVEKRDASCRVICVLEQRGHVYHLPVEIGIETSQGLRIEKVQLVDQRMTFAFDSKEKPSKIVLDPKRWIPMKVRPAQ